MDISAAITAAITWIAANSQLALYIAGGIASVVLILSLWGLIKTLGNRQGMTRKRSADTVLDRDEILTQLTEPYEPSAEDASADAGESAEPEIGGGESDLGLDLESEPDNAGFAAEEFAAPADEPAPQPSARPRALAPAKDLRSIAQSVFDANFPALHPEASAEARRNVGAFIDEMVEEAGTRLSDAEVARFSKADIQLLLYSIFAEVAKRHDEGKNGLLIGLLFGRVRHDDKPDIVELLDEAIEVCGRINTNYISVVVMCLYLRSIHLKSNDLSELETVVKYATGFGEGATFSNMRTGPLFSHGLLMYNAAMDRIEGQILRNYAPLFEVDPSGLEAYPGESASSRQMVHERLNLSPEQTRILETWGQSQCGRATATGIGWAAAAAYIERATGQPADWERMVR